MSANSKIEWCDHTFNPWIGCTKVSPGCTNCYAEARDDRFAGGIHWGKGAPRQRTSASYWKQPLKWSRDALVTNGLGAGRLHSSRARIFCASLADWLDPEVPIEWLADLLALIQATPNLDWLLLTKRPENWKNRLQLCSVVLGPDDVGHNNIATRWVHFADPPPNVWLGVSVEDRPRLNRIQILREIPAAVRFLSMEPLLESIDLNFDWNNDLARWDSVGRELPPHRIDWVIVGGESGPKARPCRVKWIRDIINQCRSAGVPVFVKQLGAKPVSDEMSLDADLAPLHLKHRKGGDPSEWPEDLCIREFPKAKKINHGLHELNGCKGNAFISVIRAIRG